MRHARTKKTYCINVVIFAWTRWISCDQSVEGVIRPFFPLSCRFRLVSLVWKVAWNLESISSVAIHLTNLARPSSHVFSLQLQFWFCSRPLCIRRGICVKGEGFSHLRHPLSLLNYRAYQPESRLFAKWNGAGEPGVKYGFEGIGQACISQVWR